MYYVNEVIKILFAELSHCGKRDDNLKISLLKYNLFRMHISPRLALLKCIVKTC